MNTLNLAAALGLALLTAATFGLLSWAIYRNMSHGQNYRAALLQKLSGLRLRRMIDALGLDADRYLHSLPVADLEQRMHHCGQCPEQPRCDEQLTGKLGRIEEVSFCPNADSLQAEAERQQAA